MEGELALVGHRAYMPRRPGFGRRGRPINLLANFFELSRVPAADMFQYDVQISPVEEENFISTGKKLPREVNRMIIDKLYSERQSDMFKGIRPAYDGMASFYMPQRLDFTSRTEKVELPERRESFKVQIKESAVVSLQALTPFLKGANVKVPQDCIQCLDVVMRSVPVLTTSTIGSSFFSGQRRVPLDAGTDIWLGYHQSVRPAHGRMLVNIDCAAAVYYKAQPLLEFARNILKSRPESISVQARNQLRSEVIGLKIEVTHRGNQKRKYRIRDVSRVNAFQHEFEIENDDGTTKKSNVAEYFESRYGMKLRYPNMPLIEVGSRKRPIHLPIEVCHIKGGERVNKKLQPAQTATMIKATAQKPHIRTSSIEKAYAERSYATDETVNAFGIGVESSMLQVQGRVLDAPRIIYRDTAQVAPQMGAWQARNVSMFSSSRLEHWGVLNLESRTRQNDVVSFVNVLSRTAHECGIIIDDPVEIVMSSQREDYQQSVFKAVDLVKRATGGKIQMLLIVLPFQDPKAYGELKRVCDTVVGVPNQCMLSKHIQKKNAMYCRNILMKMNVKLGGVNSVIDSAPSDSYLFNRPAIVFGCDVTHGAPGSSQMSIAALVASMDAYPYRFECEVRGQEARKEVVTELESMARALLLRFYINTNGKKPERILFYRDGVSEGQFEKVLKFELGALRAACQSIEKGYTPTISFVVVQKRHHARFFVTNRGDSDRSGNVPPGTIVDTAVVHPRQFDFYLVSHSGIQGTSRPTHYHVIWDENEFTADILQEITYRMCYMFARCNRSVSVVPAVYYAHLAAFRARFHARSDEYTSHSYGSGSGSASDGNSTKTIPQVIDEYRRVMYFM